MREEELGDRLKHYVYQFLILKNWRLIPPNSLCYKYRVATKATLFTQRLQALAIGTSDAAWLLHPPHMIKRQNSP
jgi:hypothetical protein